MVVHCWRKVLKVIFLWNVVQHSSCVDTQCNIAAVWMHSVNRQIYGHIV